MSTIAEETKQAINAAGRPTSTQQRQSSRPALEPVPTVHFIADDRASRTTALVFQALLFCAMCLSLLAVIQQAKSNSEAPGTVAGTGVNDAPPAVFVNAD